MSSSIKINVALKKAQIDDLREKSEKDSSERLILIKSLLDSSIQKYVQEKTVEDMKESRKIGLFE